MKPLNQNKMKQTAVEWLFEQLDISQGYESAIEILDKAKEMEKNNTDNKVIHFAEWLTKKHTSTLITLYEHFEEEYYNETFKPE
jgi:hypothetical protein